MIICAARLQQERAWAEISRLAFHSTEAPTELRDSARRARKLQVSIVSRD
eukprot:CAMPEP_0204009392 /NCGR_PEP_ID=MMETSP0360-20130528/21815_1 /ASSEMBLY_ACC=CAM_ASM_000342 /TAXON_ID=268821 /ORGANISM="Scrippsiella Hangoei, Strain SHTV-5" /LENGTH=49 /DNA_ID= /DNA_START= /DNA_END= /DNA_ORIENTATION=